ncbi:MAG: flagellar filament capping protein FliD [Rhodothermales bacterium]|nr:flagellar filament capping protein FliD [Rhodothermales bacterium]
MLSSINRALMSNNPYEQLLQQIVRIESQPRAAMEQRLRTTQRQSDILGDLDSSVSALHSLMETFTDTISTPLDGRAASISDDSYFSATASEGAVSGSHTLKVERLASTDTRLSKQYTSTGGTLKSFFDTNGAQTFNISVAAPTDADEDNREDIAVTVDLSATSLTEDEEILQYISTSINDAMNSAVDAETIESDEKAVASMVNETSDTARFTLRSGQTGFSNRVTFTDSANGLLAAMEVTTAAVATGTGGGYVTDIGTSESDSELNSKFVLDGLTMYRSNNQISDALSGVTMNLKEVQTTSLDFSVGPDTEGIKNQITDFIAKYNEIVTQLAGSTMIDGDLGVRGAFAGDPTMRSLRFNLRNDVAATVTSQSSGMVQSIAELGIDISEDGTLSIDDNEAFEDAVESDPTAFKELFTGSDGIATRIETRLDGYLGADGIFDNRVDVLDDSIRRINDQLESFDDRMSRRESQLRQQYAKIQESISLFQGQQSFISSFGGGGGAFF